MGDSKIEEIDINLTNSIRMPNFKLSKFERDKIENQTQEILKLGIIEPFNSPYSFPVFFVLKVYHRMQTEIKI